MPEPVEAIERKPLRLGELRAQPAATATLQSALEAERIAHAYLFAGPSGVGKEQAALALACARNCTQRPGVGCGGDCGVCSRIWAGSHPDVRIIRPRDEGNRNLQVDYIRQEVLPFTQFAPFEAKSAVLIFAEADVCFPSHQAEAANALLKTLEEPRAGVSFILLSARPDRLLTTIRSRCQRVRFGPLPREVIMDVLAAHDTPAADRETAAALCLGQADRALDLAQEGRGQSLLDWAMQLDEVAQDKRPGALLDAAEGLSRSDDRDLVLDTLGLLYRDLAAASLGQREQLLFAHRADEIEARTRGTSAGTWAGRYAAIQGAVAAFERNANAQVTLDALLFAL